MNGFVSPFDQEEAVWEHFPESPPPKPMTAAERKKAAQKRANQKWRSKVLGREIGQHGGERKGAGRPRKESHTITVKLNRVQQAALTEDGWGQLGVGIQMLINKYY